MQESHQIKMVVGLGNPGSRYDSTRHNIGFMTADFFKEKLASQKAWKQQGDALMCEMSLEGNKLFLIKPQSFMNLSGRPVAALQRFYKIAVEEIVVVHDDVDLPFGKLQIKAGGGDAGHNGLRSMRTELGSGEFIRVRCGIGRPAGEDPESPREDSMVDWVLGKFAGAELDKARKLAEIAAEAVAAVCKNGLAQAQRDFNRRNVLLD